MKKQILLAALCLAAFSAQAKVEHLLPRVQSLEQTAGSFALNRSVSLTDPTDNFYLKKALAEANLTVGSGPEVKVELVSSIPGAFNHQVAEFPDEAYTLKVTSDAIAIQALTSTGVTRAAQTLSQLAMETSALEGVNITDWPAFKVRGFMQDIGRSFLSVDELKRELDLLAHFKVNVFHWHLTDYTGWRLEIKQYPQLTSDVAITRFPGKYYTQEQAREIQDYAFERGITVIPEIDFPGHSHPFTNAMGHTMLTSEGQQEVDNILDEVIALFDKAPYIHLGGDEVAFDNAILEAKINRLHNQGKKVVIWNRFNSPIKDPNSLSVKPDMTTNWATSGSMTAGFPNIDMRYNYTNHFDVFADLVGIYKSTIFGVQQGNENIGGTISAAWNDTYTPTEDDILRQNNQYANIIASCSRAWQGGGKQYIEQGGTILPNSGDEYDDFSDWERRFIFHKSTTLASAKHQIPYVAQANERWFITDQIPNGGSNTAILGPEKFKDEETIPVAGADYTASMYTGAGFYLRHIWHGNVKGIYDNPQGNMTSYAWTYVYSPAEQDAAAFIEFYTYSRSGNETGPSQGCWDRRGSKIWWNGTEIPAPTWSENNQAIRQDQNTSGLGNQNFTAREPVALHLKQGWNKVFLKLPHVNAGGTARDKWQFTFAIIDPTTQDALPGLVYSPSKAIDSNAELVAAKILEVRGQVAAIIGENVGQYASSTLDQTLLAKADEIEATLGAEATPAERDAQVAELQTLLNAFKAGFAASGINQPAPGKYYNMRDMRKSLYASDNAGTLHGDANPTDKSAWKFIARTDGKFDIQNYSTKAYIAPTAADNSALTTTATAPAAGWEIKPAATTGWVIVVSGTTQFNQTQNSGQGFNVFNWGSGTNTTDTGCQYIFSLTDYQDPVVEPDPLPVELKPVVTIVDRTLTGAGPIRISDHLAAPILSSAASTAAFHFTPAEAGEFYTLGAATCTTHPASYYALTVHNGASFGPHYIDIQDTEFYKHRTQAGLGVGKEVKLVIVNNPDGYYELYYNGELKKKFALSDIAGHGFTHFGNVDGSDALYIGGIVTADDPNKYPFVGRLHSARFWTTNLTAQEVAALEYDNLTDNDPNAQAPVEEDSLAELSDAKVIGGKGQILVSGKCGMIFTPQGQLIASGSGTFQTLPGVYLVKVDNRIFKVLVR